MHGNLQNFTVYLATLEAIMIILIRINDTLQLMAINKQQSPNLRMPVES